MWKFLANLLLAGLAIGLTFFTGSRTLDLLAQWLPANQQIMQYLGLAAFEGGLYFWALFFVTAAKGAAQRGIAVGMIVVCFIAVATATVADLLLVGSESGKLPSIQGEQKQAIVVFVGIVIVLNVAAFLGAKLSHPDKLKEIAIQDAEDHISDMELKLIRRLAPGVATQMAPLKAEQWVNETWERMFPGSEQARTIEGSIQRASLSSSATASTPTPPPTQPKKRWNPFSRQPENAASAPVQQSPDLNTIFQAFQAWQAQQISGPTMAPRASATDETLPPRPAPAPTTEDLSPLPVAPTQMGNGASQNGHRRNPDQID